MNEGPAGLRLLKGCMLVCIGICLLFAISPLADFDLDGLPDSFMTDGLLLIFGLPGLIIPVFFTIRLPGPSLASPGLFSFLTVPPPETI
jgi:hypothetical protein